MVEIDQQLLQKVLAAYKPEQRFLKAANLEYPFVAGIFLIGPTYYGTEPVNHATDPEIQICMHQLLYTSVAELMKTEEIKELRGLDFFELQREAMVIRKSQKKFIHPIKTDIEIKGEAEIKGYKKRGNLFILETDFQFQNKNCTGSLESVIILPKNN
jgi:hypothetical protein